ncbi:uncharacterized protein N7479_011065 [Penicillium vulpinum]|uniref:uncharacterized protein n=1 Tax=Penicillium vulpinum TaxID=29845 RepID=UPI00254783A3|nr:uncharacterized protein N7479_011065 [Penicillium vulpinum]KAJ5952652.1 hypothetical protein N7479_011065 [Penicillium vulpinum]
MTKSNITSLPSLPAEAIRLSNLLEAFFQEEKSWTGLLLPDQRVLITFIAQNYDTRSTPNKSATQSDNGPAYYPRTWRRKKHQVKKAIQRTVDLASSLLERSWRSQLGAKSLLDLPAELMLLIERELSDNELYNLCRANRDLYHFLGAYLCRRGIQDLRAFERSLERNKKESFIKAIEVLSDVSETALWSASKQLYYMFLVGKDGLLGWALMELILTIQKNEHDEWKSVTNCLKWEADPNHRFEDGVLWMRDPIKSSTAYYPSWDLENTQKQQARAYRHVKLLLAYGADPNSVGSLSVMDSMLHLACLHYQPKIGQALLQAGADPSAKDAHGRTPLGMVFVGCQFKSSNPDTTLLEFLLADPRIKLDERDNYGCTPLGIAMGCNSTSPIVLRFTERVVRMPDEVDINSQDNQGRTPLCYCIATNKYDITRLLLAQNRLDPNLGPTDNFPLLLAVTRDSGTLEYLLELKRLDVNKQTNTGQTALLKAIDVGNREVIKMLAKAGANPDIGMSEGETARQQILAAGIRVKWKTCPV